VDVLTPKHLSAAAWLLAAGEIVAVPTPRWYMLCARTTDTAAAHAIFRIKQRPEHKPLLLLLEIRHRARSSHPHHRGPLRALGRQPHHDARRSPPLLLVGTRPGPTGTRPGRHERACRMILVLWDIDRTLVYTGDIDRRVYREAFTSVVGRPPAALPARGTGVTMPLAVRELLRVNQVPEQSVEVLAERIVSELPERLAGHRELLTKDGIIMPGAVDALATVQQAKHLIATVLTGNLRGNAESKLSALGLIGYLDTTIGGYASDDAHRPGLVRIAQDRAAAKHGHRFHRDNTVIVGDSLEDVRTGREGGARVIAVASGTTTEQQLRSAGAEHVLPDLTSPATLLRLIDQAW
jgi:phosphoglycolate phosphatase-like HAD superfamily hydrolase